MCAPVELPKLNAENVGQDVAGEEAQEEGGAAARASVKVTSILGRWREETAHLGLASAASPHSGLNVTSRTRPPNFLPRLRQYLKLS